LVNFPKLPLPLTFDRSLLLQPHWSFSFFSHFILLSSRAFYFLLAYFISLLYFLLGFLFCSSNQPLFVVSFDFFHLWLQQLMGCRIGEWWRRLCGGLGKAAAAREHGQVASLGRGRRTGLGTLSAWVRFVSCCCLRWLLAVTAMGLGSFSLFFIFLQFCTLPASFSSIFLILAEARIDGWFC
jgi:hypothetical protein